MQETNDCAAQIDSLKKQLKAVKTSDRVQAAKLRAQLEKNELLEQEIEKLRTAAPSNSSDTSNLERQLEQKSRQNELILQQLSEMEALYLAATQEAAPSKSESPSRDSTTRELSSAKTEIAQLHSENQRLRDIIQQQSQSPKLVKKMKSA